MKEKFLNWWSEFNIMQKVNLALGTLVGLDFLILIGIAIKAVWNATETLEKLAATFGIIGGALVLIWIVISLIIADEYMY